MYSVWGISKGGKERGSGDASLKGKILKGDVKGGQLRMPSLLTPSCLGGLGWDFFNTFRHGDPSPNYIPPAVSKP